MYLQSKRCSRWVLEFLQFFDIRKHEFVKQRLFLVSRLYWLSLLMNSHNKDRKTPHLDIASKLAVYFGLSPFPVIASTWRERHHLQNIRDEYWEGDSPMYTCPPVVEKSGRSDGHFLTHFGTPKILTLATYGENLYKTRKRISTEFWKMCSIFLFSKGVIFQVPCLLLGV